MVNEVRGVFVVLLHFDVEIGAPLPYGLGEWFGRLGRKGVEILLGSANRKLISLVLFAFLEFF